MALKGEKAKEYQKQYREKHKKYFSEYKKQYRINNKDKIAEYFKQYYKDNKDKFSESQKKRIQTFYGRASMLINGYKREDKKYKRGECTLTTEWIIDNIFSGQKCVYCGETDWQKLGCDRINNDLSHSPDNVVCCCAECNKKRGKKVYEEYLKEIDKSQENTHISILRR